jgi:catechol 2,3-dioxygenase-like lactoylglutathione lyase family enzyme
MRLRAVELEVPDAAAAAEFLERHWGLLPAGTRGAVRYFRGTGDHPYILSVAQAGAPAVAAITFAGSPAEVDAVRERAAAAGARCDVVASLDAPGGGSGLVVHGPESQAYRFVTESAPLPAIADRDKPIQITHAVLNSADVAACERFVEGVLGFRISDRTRAMTFVRCNRKHHALAFAHAGAASLNHIAFEMPDLESVMRGIGRMRDAGVECVWGPGRHGPGNNVFGYFLAPFGGIIEYTAEVSEIGDDYRVGTPEDWKWPPGRIDHWGVSRKDTAKTGAAELHFRFHEH